MSKLLSRPRRARARSAAVLAVSSVLASPAAAQQAPADDATALEEISVTANRVEGPAAAIGSAVSSISGAELERRQIRVVSDVLRELPGVAVNRTGPVGALTQVRIRGSEGNQTLVIVDGIRMNDPGTSAEFDFANLLNLEVERVDVLRGPQSALYGSDAVGGVINIATRKGEPGPTRFRANIEGGSFGALTGTASVSGGTQAYDYLIAGQGFRTSGISTAGGTLNGSLFNTTYARDRDGYESGTGLAKVSVRPNEMFEFTGVARYTEFEADRDGFDAAQGLPYAAAIENRDTEKGKQFYGRAQVKATLLDGAWDHVAGMSYTNSDRRSFDGDDVKTFASVGEMTRFDYQTNYRFATQAGLPASHVLTFGADATRDAVDSFTASPFDRPPSVKQHIDNTGLVGQYQLGLFDSLYVTGSIRHDFNDRFEDDSTYRLASAYTFERSKTKIRASYGTGVKNPTTFELFGFADNFVSNPDLTPERAQGWDVGVDQPFWNDRVILDATYFQQRVKDLISSVFVPAKGASQPVNLAGKSKIDGVELGLTVRPFADVSIRAAYTFTDGEDPAGDTLVRRPRHIGSVNVTYVFLDGRANANLGVVYNGRQKDDRFDAETFERTPVSLKDYTLVNLAASYKVTGNAEVYGRIENLFDKKYEEVFTYNTPGRAAYGGVKVSF
ncbi:vitamin B12 transporter [Methylopila capsulata]|uniref:TonB-dependent receptor n=1 Tax=Methylopila capsulata TaxID=61654 RepID=A0A9W6IWX6_9HYPH|nr:TonB-dependent receptor [Methylopila capsulata]MBM7852461.1 vitamin B12 transporter [Methylopila capsulata]GLK56670.1 TonB-dependent receptor [Methylopila capsulata]